MVSIKSVCGGGRALKGRTENKAPSGWLPKIINTSVKNMKVMTVVESKTKVTVLQQLGFVESRRDPRDDGASTGKMAEGKERSGEPNSKGIITSTRCLTIVV